mmetsp:Transcript_37534/g.98280  ORF Transcript_37534/g.98280 Transcript_37534/m.98280 type:complete len:519 (-) Transcript_37534:12-1568(-)
MFALPSASGLSHSMLSVDRRTVVAGALLLVLCVVQFLELFLSFDAVIPEHIVATLLGMLAYVLLNQPLSKTVSRCSRGEDAHDDDEGEIKPFKKPSQSRRVNSGVERMPLGPEITTSWDGNKLPADGIPVFMKNQSLEDSTRQLLKALRPPIKETRETTKNLVSRIRAAVVKQSPKAMVFAFGSAFSGFRSKSSDVDVTVIVDPEAHQALLQDPPVSRAMGQEKLLFEVITPALLGDGFREIRRVRTCRQEAARVTFESEQGDRVVVYCNQVLPMVATKLVRQYSLMDGRCQNMGLLIRHWANRRGLLDRSASGSGLNSYCWVLLVIFYLQVSARVLPSLQKLAVDHEKANGTTKRTLSWLAEAPSWRALIKSHTQAVERQLSFIDAEHGKQVTTVASGTEDSNLPGILRGFFAFYAHEFNWQTEVVSIRTGRRSAQPETDRAPCFVEDPLRPGCNLAELVPEGIMDSFRNECQRSLHLIEQNALVRRIFGGKNDPLVDTEYSGPWISELPVSQDVGA